MDGVPLSKISAFGRQSQRDATGLRHRLTSGKDDSGGHITTALVNTQKDTVTRSLDGNRETAKDQFRSNVR